MARIAIVGVGAIGSAIAATLQMNGHHEVILCTRRPLNGLRVETPEKAISVTAKAISNPELAEAVDWVFFATKTYDIKQASAWLPGLCRGNAPVAVFQNGVEHRENFVTCVNADRIVPVIIDCPVERQ